VTTCVTDEAWWDLVKAQGWYRLEHSNTAAEYGRWFVLPLHFLLFRSSLAIVRYPVIVDAVVQSKGMGFVGNALSTFSILARRRVED